MIISTASVIQIVSEQLFLVLILSLPIIGTIALSAILLSLLQAATQIQEQTIQFLVKLLVFGLFMAISGNWMLQSLISYAQQVMLQI